MAKSIGMIKCVHVIMYLYPHSVLVILPNSFVAILECLGDILGIIILQILWAPYFLKSTFIFPRLDYFYLIFLHSLKFLDIILIFTRGIFMDPWRNHNAAVFQPRRDFPFVLPFLSHLKICDWSTYTMEVITVNFWQNVN